MDTLARSNRVGVMGFDFYFYRVGRIGQITAEKSLKRLHVVETMLGSLNETLLSFEAEIGAQITYSISRIVEWCGDNTPYEPRQQFETAAGHLYSRLPEAWISRFEREYPNLATTNMPRLRGSRAGNSGRFYPLSRLRRRKA